MNNVCKKLFPGKKHDSLLQTENYYKKVYQQKPCLCPCASFFIANFNYYDILLKS